MAELNSNWANLFGHRTAIAEWASILAIFVSFYAAITIARVRSQILGRVRLPNLLSSIERNAKSLASLLGEYDENKDQIGLEVSRCEAHLKLLRVTIKGTSKTTARTLLREIARYKGRSQFLFVFSSVPKNTKADAWALYELLNTLIEEMKYALRDQKIGG